jgi:hypothetical protein
VKEELTKQLPLKDRRKKKKHCPNTWQDYTMTDLLLKYQHQDWILEK